MKLTADWITKDSVHRLFSAFESQGHQIFFVGGCVRNALLGMPVADLDVSTSATPDQTIQVSESTGFKWIPSGIDHGTVTVVVDGESFEITSFRKDVETHGRRAVVAYSDNILDDALRRDFTMNALYANRHGNVFDPLNGLVDLNDRKVRFIANADDRIKEDYLRILRYFRFHAWYGNQDAGMDAEALSSIAENIDGLSLISKERIGAELRKILSAVDPVRTIAAMENCGVLTQILPGGSARALGPLRLLEDQISEPIDWQRRLLALGGEEQTNQLRLSKTVSKRIKSFRAAMDRGAGPTETAFRYGRETALDVALLTAASLAQQLDGAVLDHIETGTNAKFPISAADLPTSLQGKAIGEQLNALQDMWIASGFTMNKQELLA